MGLYRGDLPSKIMKNLAFHRTTAENAAKILVEGIKPFAEMHPTLTLPDIDAPNFWAVYEAMVEAGFKGHGALFFAKGLKDMGAPAEMVREAAFEGRWTMNAIASKTFARQGGVETRWAEDGLTVAIDLDALPEGAQWWADSNGRAEMDGHGDIEIHGAVPASAVLGVVSDEWMNTHGLTVEDGRF